MTDFAIWVTQTRLENNRVTRDCWHNFYVWNVQNNPTLAEVWYGGAPYFQPQFIEFYDRKSSDAVTSLCAAPNPSFIDNYEGYKPTNTVWCNTGGPTPLVSYTQDASNYFDPPPRDKYKPRRSYWTGIPAKRRNLPTS